MVEKYVIITVNGCPWCEKAISLAHEKGFDFIVQQLTWGSELKEIQSRENHWRTVPMVYREVNGLREFIGGFTDFEKYVNQKS
jgi:glutaredoxin